MKYEILELDLSVVTIIESGGFVADQWNELFQSEIGDSDWDYFLFSLLDGDAYQLKLPWRYSIQSYYQVAKWNEPHLVTNVHFAG